MEIEESLQRFREAVNDNAMFPLITLRTDMTVARNIKPVQQLGLFYLHPESCETLAILESYLFACPCATIRTQHSLHRHNMIRGVPMGTNDNRRAHLSRRQFITAGIATGASLLATNSAARQDPSSGASSLEPKALLDAILDRGAPEAAIEATVELFARSGIAVFDDAVTQPLVPPAAPVSPLSFQRWQLDSIVAEIANGNARPAIEYDDMFPTQTETGDAVPTVGELLAGYYGGGDTPGADFTRVFFNRILTDNLNITAAYLPAPTLVVSLLAGEIMGQFQEAAGLGMSSVDPKMSSSKYSPATMAYAQVPGLSLPGLPDIPAIPNIELPVMPASSGVCGAAQGFISIVTQRVFSVMKAAEDVQEIPILGGIFGAILEGIKIGLGIITKAVDALLAPVLGVIRSIGAALSVASVLVGTLSPWTVAIAFNPTRNRFGIDAEVVSGKIDVTAGGWDRIVIPPALSECASLIGLALPKPTAADAPAHLFVHQPSPLIVVDNPELRLDDVGAASATYVTQNETAEQAKGDEVISIAWVQATIERDDLKKLRDDLFNILFSQLPSLVTQIVRPIIGPVADQLTSKLIELVKVSAQQPLFVAHHTPKEEPEDDGPPATAAGCFPGKYLAVDPAAVQRLYVPMPIDVTGAMIWEFLGNGTFEISYQELVMSVELDPSAPPFTFAFSGTQAGTYTADNGILTLTVTADNMVVDADMIAIGGEFRGPVSSGMTGTYTCGTSIIWQLQMIDGNIVAFELTPIE